MSKYKFLLNLLGIALALVLVRATAPITPPTPPCEARILLDAQTEYDVDTAEVGRLLEENGYPCPYVLDVVIWGRTGPLDRVLFWGGHAILGTYATYGGGRHVIFVYLADGLHLGDAPGRDLSVVRTLFGTERWTWIVLHELGHMIQGGEWLRYSQAKELWCDHFANENYGHYAIIRTGNDRQDVNRLIEPSGNGGCSGS